MDAPTWVYASIAAVTVFHLFVLAYLRARRGGQATAASGSADAGEPAGDADDGDIVRCRECGAENQRRFRFCRNCVAELPGGSLSQQGGGGATPGIL